MKTIGLLVIPSLVVIVSCMSIHSEVTKPVVFRDVSNPGEWAIGDKLAYLVITDKNWSTYYSSPPMRTLRKTLRGTSHILLTGRPLGTECFIKRLEKILKRDISPKKPGRPKKEKEN